jgi:hypothetical protein
MTLAHTEFLHIVWFQEAVVQGLGLAMRRFRSSVFNAVMMVNGSINRTAPVLPDRAIGRHNDYTLSDPAALISGFFLGMLDFTIREMWVPDLRDSIAADFPDGIPAIPRSNHYMTYTGIPCETLQVFQMRWVPVTEIVAADNLESESEHGDDDADVDVE